MARKPPIRRPPPTAASSSAKVTNLPGTAPRPVPGKQQTQQAPPNFDALRQQNDGWTSPRPPDAQEFPLYITKKALKEGLRFHVMKFVPPHGRLTKSGSAGIDPTNQDEFTRPVTLQRRDPRQPPPGREVKEEAPEPMVVDSDEAQKLAQAKVDREAQRALDDAQKAPVARDPNPKRAQPKEREKGKKHATQVHYEARTDEQKKQAEIRYEEALPWHLEDADGKNVWVGQYEAPLSHAKVALQIHNGGFRMVPLEKWYKFTSKRGAIKTMSIEEAEKAMGQKMPMSRWAVRDAQREQAEKAMAESRTIMNGKIAIKQESSTFRQASRREKQDHDDIDYSGDEFQDDDENPNHEPDRDEEVKDSADRVRREQLKANNFGARDEIEVDKEEDEEKKEELERKLFGKDLRKALKRRDKQFQYDSDSDKGRDPFASSEVSIYPSASESFLPSLLTVMQSESDETDSDDEKEDEQKGEKDKEKDKANGSGSNTKGSSTPQGKKAVAEAAKKGKSLKRPGSPLPSDSSGTESTRKKKKTGPSGSSRGDTPLARSRAGAGSTSDGEGTAGEMSDGAGGKKKKKQHGHLAAGLKASPAGSRAGSPNPPQQGKASASKVGTAATSRAGSPDKDKAEPIDVSKYINPPTVQEIIEALPPRPEGVPMKKFITSFKSRLEKDGQPGLMPQKVFLKLVLSCSVYSKEDKLLRRKPE